MEYDVEYLGYLEMKEERRQHWMKVECKIDVETS